MSIGSVAVHGPQLPSSRWARMRASVSATSLAASAIMLNGASLVSCLTVAPMRSTTSAAAGAGAGVVDGAGAAISGSPAASSLRLRSGRFRPVSSWIGITMSGTDASTTSAISGGTTVGTDSLVVRTSDVVLVTP